MRDPVKEAMMLGAVERAFAVIAPPDARGEIYEVPGHESGRGPWRCGFCGATITLPAAFGKVPRANLLDALRELLTPHFHVSPQPLTAAERQAARARRIHQCGAMEVR